MFTLDIKVNGRKTIVKSGQLVGNNVGVDQVHFECSEEWNDKTIVATFERTGDVYSVICDENHNALIPHEVLLSNDTVTIGIFASSGENIVIAAEPVRVDIRNGSEVESTAEPGEYLNLYMQILAKLDYNTNLINERTVTYKNEKVEMNWIHGAYIYDVYISDYPSFSSKDIPVKGNIKLINFPSMYKGNIQLKYGNGNGSVIVITEKSVGVEFPLNGVNSITITVNSEEQIVRDNVEFEWVIPSYVKDVAEQCKTKVEQCEIELENKVDKTTTVAGLPLDKNISVYELARKIVETSDFGLKTEEIIDMIVNPRIEESFVNAEYIERMLDTSSAIIGICRNLIDDGNAESIDKTWSAQYIAERLKNFIPYSNFSAIISNYAKIDNTYTKNEVQSLINAINSFSLKVVNALPISDIDEHTIYLMPKDSEENDNYDEYIFINNEWERIGNTGVDLREYYTKGQLLYDVLPRLLSPKVEILNEGENPASNPTKTYSAWHILTSFVQHDALKNYQKKLIAGDNVSIEEDNVINAVFPETPTSYELIDTIEIKEECVGALTFENMEEVFANYSQIAIFGIIPYTKTNTAAQPITIKIDRAKASVNNISAGLHYFSRAGLQNQPRESRLYFRMDKLIEVDNKRHYIANGAVSNSTAYSAYTNSAMYGIYPNALINGTDDTVGLMRYLSVHQTATWAVGTKIFLLARK